MATIITMPRYGANMDEGTVAAWMVSEGDTVEKGEVIGEIAIEKLSNDLEAPVSGVILKLIAEEEETLDCGEPIAIIGEEGEDISSYLSSDKIETQVEDETPAEDTVTDFKDAVIVEMPRYGATMEEGTISEWLVEEGDEVEEGDVIGEIAIEKLSNELLAPISGIIRKLLAEEEETLDCGEPIAIIGSAEANIEALLNQRAGQASSTGVEKSVDQEAPPAKDVKPTAPKSASSLTITPKAKELAEKDNIDYSNIVGTGRHGAITREDIREYTQSSGSIQRDTVGESKATPKAIKLAEEMNVNYRHIKGSGRHGMVTREDIRNAGSSAKPITKIPQAKRKRMSEMQKMIAKGMMSSLRETAQTTISMDMDVSEMVKAYKANKASYAAKNVKLSYTAIIIKMVAQAIVEHDALRTTKEDNEFVTTDQINMGVAIDVPDGLVVPNIKAAHTKSIEQIAIELADLANRARENNLTMDELQAGTFTITNLGMFGIKYFTPVLNAPESGILGIGTLVEQPVVRDGGIFVTQMMNFSLTHDHRIVNGAPAARFLNTINELLQDTSSWL